MITQEELKRHLEYDSLNGGFKWKLNPCFRYSKSSIGTKAGSKGIDGYISISLSRNRYKVHRLVWFYHYGYFPENLIDHIDRNKSNNKIENLREVTNSCNQRNSFTSSRNKTGVRGISFRRCIGKFVASITVDNKIKEVGSFKDFTEAVAHRLAAEQALNWEGCDSSSNSYLYMKDYVDNELKSKGL